MATGDIKNNLRKLGNSLKGVKYEKDVDYESLANGVSTSYLPIYHFAFMDYSRAIATEISGLGIELLGRSDQRFIEGMYKVLREIFSYKPPVTRDQFFSNGYSERKVIMATEILNMLVKRHKSITPKPKVRVNISMNTTSSSSSLHSKPKPKSAPIPAPQKTQVHHKKATSAKRPCSTVLPQVVSEVRDPTERTPILLSDTSSIMPNPSRLLDMSPLPAAPSGYNPAPSGYNPSVYSSLADAKQRQDSVEIVSLNDESELSDLAIRPIDIVKTPGRPLVESHRAPPPLHPVTSSPVEAQLPPGVMQKLTTILQENESLASQLKDLTKKMDVINQEKENLAARVTILENRVQLVEHKSSQSASRRTLETPVEEDVVQVPVLENHDQKEDKENIISSIYDGPSVKSVHEQITKLAKVSPVQAATEPSKQNLLSSETNGVHVVDEQAERIKNMMKDTQNLLGMNDSLTSGQ